MTNLGKMIGLGYGDLEKMFYGGISGPQAGILLIAKLAATTAVYAWGGAGGIFSPTLFCTIVCGVFRRFLVNRGTGAKIQVCAPPCLWLARRSILSVAERELATIAHDTSATSFTSSPRRLSIRQPTRRQSSGITRFCPKIWR